MWSRARTKFGNRGRAAAAPRTTRAAIVVNGTVHGVDISAGTRLLDVLRNDLGLTGTKEACGRGECGACTVLMDGRPVMSCLVLAARAGEIETIEGLAEEGRPLREAFADVGAFQCGFCTPGQVVRAVALLRAGPLEDTAGLRRSMSGNICRCTGYAAILAAVERCQSGEGSTHGAG